jgi:hypothetical protein
MNYKRIYNEIIENRINNPFKGYTETHHILPRSLGGSDEKENLVKLSAREHFICHLLLTKIHKDDTIEHYKMLNAFIMMKMNSNTQDRYFNSYLYEKIRIKYSKMQSKKQSGKGNNQYGKMWITNGKDNKLIYRDNSIPVGWKKGRKLKSPKTDALNEKFRKRKQKTASKKLQTTLMYEEYYKIYCEYGWEKFKEITDYKFSQQNLVMQFKHRVKDYTSQRGRKR